MLDVNLGNKTLVVGVLIALILAYGMVNFNGGTPQTDLAFPKVEASSYTSSSSAPSTETEVVNVASSAPDLVDSDSAALSAVQERKNSDPSWDEDDERHYQRRHAGR